jgi:lipid II:glycine glycyltransferase (peptidoglycan interpeptide bridge formation enzyme)
MVKCYWTDSKDDFYDWDNFLISSKTGYPNQLSHWQKAYEKYGLKINLLLARDEQGRVQGGLVTSMLNILFFKALACSMGPITRYQNTNLAIRLISEFKKEAKRKKVTICQIGLPILEADNPFLTAYTLPKNVLNDKIFNSSKIGSKLQGIHFSQGIRASDLRVENDFDETDFIKRFKPNTRRDIRKSSRNNLELFFAKSPEEIRNAYGIILQNSLTFGYGVRPWEDIDDTLNKLVSDGSCLIPCCKQDDKLLGALIVFETGQRLSYILGGTLRTKPDLLVGQFLHYEMMKYSIKKGYKFYDLSIGGSRGVKKFKEGLGGKPYKFVLPRYWVFNKLLFALYNFLFPKLKKNKLLISKVLKLLK